MNEYSENLEYALTLAAFILGVMNYNENLTQNDKQDLLKKTNEISDEIINKIDRHLQSQDQKIDKILKILEHQSF